MGLATCQSPGPGALWGTGWGGAPVARRSGGTCHRPHSCPRHGESKKFFFLHHDLASAHLWANPWAAPGHQPRECTVFSRTLMQTTGWKDFKSTSGVAPLQDFPAGQPWCCCLAVYSVATNDYKGTATKVSHLPLGMSAGSVRLLCLLTFQQPYSLKPPGASLGTLPRHPICSRFTLGWCTPVPCSILPLQPSLPPWLGSSSGHSPLAGSHGLGPHKPGHSWCLQAGVVHFFSLWLAGCPTSQPTPSTFLSTSTCRHGTTTKMGAVADYSNAWMRLRVQTTTHHAHGWQALLECAAQYNLSQLSPLQGG